MKYICLKCHISKVVKNWKRQGKQRLLCKNCWYVWEHWKDNNSKSIDFNQLFKEYVNDDLKYRQMCQTMNVTKRTIQTYLDKANFKKIIAILSNLNQLYF